MSTKNKENLNQTTNKTAAELENEADVLFQKIYNKWYAFTTANDECFMSEVSEEVVQERMRRTKAS